MTATAKMTNRGLVSRYVRAARAGGAGVRGLAAALGHALGVRKVADVEGLEDLVRVLRVTDVLEGLGRVARSLSNEDLVTAGVLTDELGHIVHWLVHTHPCRQ